MYAPGGAFHTSPSSRQVTLKDSLKSYQEVAESETYSQPLAAFIPDVLRHFDLSDCHEVLQGKKLKRI